MGLACRWFLRRMNPGSLFSRAFLQGRDEKTSQIAVNSPAYSEEQLADLSSGWTIHFPDDAKPVTLASLNSWTELAGKQFFSGEAVYTRSVSIKSAPKSGMRICLDFGPGTPTTDNRRPGASGTRALLDPPIREAAIVFVNGQRVGSLWHPPYRIDISKFTKSGENKIEVRVYNTAINLLAGQPPRDYTALRAKYGRPLRSAGHGQPETDSLRPFRSDSPCGAGEQMKK